MRGEPGAGEPAARCGRRVALRHHRRPLRRRRAVGVAARRRGTAAPRSSVVLDRVPADADREIARPPPPDAGPSRARRRGAPGRRRDPAGGRAAPGRCARARACLARRARRRCRRPGRRWSGGRSAVHLRACPPAVVVAAAARSRRRRGRGAPGRGRSRLLGGAAGGRKALRSGALLRGEVLARWHEVVGTGDVMRALETRVGWLRDRLASIVTGAPRRTRSCRTRSSTASKRWSEPPPSGPPSGRRGPGATRPPGRALLSGAGAGRAPTTLAAAARGGARMARRRLRPRP